MENTEEILSSIKCAPSFDDINKKRLKLLEDKSNSMMYKRIYTMCEKIVSECIPEEISFVSFNNNDTDNNNMLKKIFFDNIDTHIKILAKELGKKGYNFNIENVSDTEYKTKYYSSYDMLYKLKISVKQENVTIK